MEKNPRDTALHIDQLETMFMEEWSADEITNVVYELLRTFHRTRLPERCLHFEQILLWVCGRVPPREDLIRRFIYLSHHPHTHALEQILMRYEGPVLPLDWFYLCDVDHFYYYGIEYVETLLGYDNVIDVDALRPIYEELLLHS